MGGLGSGAACLGGTGLLGLVSGLPCLILISVCKVLIIVGLGLNYWSDDCWLRFIFGLIRHILN
jgi:hypothetical protein